MGSTLPIRNRSSRRFRSAAAIALALGAASAEGAASVNAVVDSQRGFLNEALTLTLTIADFSAAEPPLPPQSADWRITLAGGPADTRQVAIHNGVRSQSVSRVYRYELLPQRAGALKIPPFTVEVDGQTRSTDPIVVVISAAEEDPLITVEVTCVEPRLYVGQTALFELVISVKRAVISRAAFDERDMLRQISGSLGPFPSRGLDVDRTTRRMSDGSREVYYRYSAATRITVDHPGPLSFDDVAISIDYPTAAQRDWFDGLVATRVRRIRAAPTIAAPEVLPIPSEGRPETFNGAVGQFEIQVSANPTNVTLGAPIALAITISGEGPIEALPGPLLSKQADLTRDFQVPPETLAGSLSSDGQQKRFTQSIRAKRADVRAIPPLEYAFFDPRAGEYRVARSAPIPIQVAAGAQLDSSDLAGIGPRTPAEASVAQRVDGLRDIVTEESALLATIRPVTATQLALATAAPPAAFSAYALFGLVRTRKVRSAGQRRRRAAREARVRLAGAHGGDVAGAIQAALTRFVADRLDQPPARFTGQEALELLRGRPVAAETLDRLARLFEQCEAAAYAGADRDSEALLAAARDCLERLEQERL